MCVENSKENKWWENNMRILVIDDDTDLREIITEYAKYEKYEIYEAEDGIKGLELIKSNDYDLIILDIMMPKIDGFTVVKEIKKIKDIPIIMLSARSEEYDKLYGYELGIVDYVTKPFSPRELMARIKVANSRNNEYSNKIYKFSNVVIENEMHKIEIDGKKVEFTLKEYDTLIYLIKNKGIVLTREQILNEVWGYDYFGIDRTVDTHIKLIRNKLGKYKNHIKTLRGVGYKFEETI